MSRRRSDQFHSSTFGTLSNLSVNSEPHSSPAKRTVSTCCAPGQNMRGMVKFLSSNKAEQGQMMSTGRLAPGVDLSWPFTGKSDLGATVGRRWLATSRGEIEIKSTSTFYSVCSGP